MARQSLEVWARGPYSVATQAIEDRDFFHDLFKLISNRSKLGPTKHCKQFAKI